MRKETNNQGISFIYILIFIALVVGVSLYFIWKSYVPPVANQPVTSANPTFAPLATINIPVNSPLPVPLPSGTPIPLRPDDGVKGTFTIGMGSHSGPTMTRIVFDPLDVKKGQVLTLTLSAESASPITSMTGTLQEDNSNQNIVFNLSSGTTTKGIWTSTTTLTDSVDYKYILTLFAKSSGGNSSVTIAIRS